MLRKKSILFAVLLLMGSVIFAGGTKEAAVDPNQPITLTVLTTAVTQNPEGPLAERFIAEFMAENPNIRIEVSGVPMNQALTKITTLAAAGSLPDLYVTTENIAGAMNDMGICEDFGPYLTASEKNNIVPAVLKGSTYDSKIIMYPWYASPNALIYRADWFEATGLKAPETLTDVRNAAKALTRDTDNDGVTDQYGFGMIGTNDDSGQTRFVMIMRAFDAKELYLEDGAWKTDVGSPASVEAFKYFTDLKNVDKVVPPGALENSFNENVNLMAANQISMLIAGSNSIGKIMSANPDLQGKIHSVEMPRMQDSYTPLGVLGWAMNPESRHKEAAVKFVKFLNEKERAIEWVETTGRMPVMLDAIEASEYLKTPLFAGFVDAFMNMQQIPTAGIYPQVKNVLGRTYQKIMSSSNVNIEREVQAAGREIQSIINNI